MSQALPIGKLPPELLRALLDAGAPLPAEVRLGPRVGEDAAAIDVEAGTLVAATDPITLTGSGIGAHAVVINANDVAVMGAAPRWFLAAVLLPPGSDESLVREVFDGIRRALDAVGAALVGGHTEVTAAVTQPVDVGQMLGLAERGRIVATGGARPGDVVVQVGPAPVEGAAVLAAERPQDLGGVAPELLAAARRAVEDPGVSVVGPALLAAECGATALHDPTEGGLATGLLELAEASGVGLRIDAERVPWFEPGVAVCRALGADPWGALASGALLATFPERDAGVACAALEDRGWTARAIGVATRGSGAHTADGAPLPRFARDEVARVLDPAAPPTAPQAAGD